MTFQVHTLKCAPSYWWALQEHGKNFEVRRDDRGFQKGDLLTLVPFGDGENRHGHAARGYLFGGEVVSIAEAPAIHRRVTYILTGGQHGIKAGYVVLGLTPCDEDGEEIDDESAS